MMAIEVVSERLSPDRLREVVLGKDLTFSRREAIVLLKNVDLADKSQVLERVLRDESDDPSLRYLAATTLYQLKLPETQEILLESSQRIQNPRVLESVVKALGRIGDERALEAVMEIKERSEGRTGAQAEFAAQLIAHRLGLKGYELPIPADGVLLKLEESRAHVFEFGPASRHEARICLESLASEPFGIEYSEEFMYEIDCLPGISQMLLTNMEFAEDNAVEKLRERKAILAIVASKFQETGRYSTAFLVFTWRRPRSRRLHLLAHRPNGDQLFAGIGQIEGGQLKFAMNAVSRPGAFPIRAEGVYEAGRFEMSLALSESCVQRRREPPKG
jgi:hypothetical protein